MPRQLQPSRDCLALVESFEGLRRTAGRLQHGGWTIGYGHTLTAREGAVVSPEDAEALLIYDLRHEAERIRPLIYTPVSQNQFDSLVAFSFNIGFEAFQHSDLLKRLNEGDYLGAASTLERWRAADFEGERLIIDGLVRRRAAEKALFLKPPGGYTPVPTPVLRPLFDPEGGDPIDARAGRAVRLVAALDGEASLSRLDDAVDSVGAILRKRFPSVSEPAPFEAPQATDAAPLEEAEPYPGPETEGLEGFEADGRSESAEAADLQLDPFAADATAEAATPVESRRRGAGLIGLVGLALFVLAIVSMLTDRATLLNLAAGLCGALCLAYVSAVYTRERSRAPKP